MDNKHRELFVTKQSKGCNFMPKCTKIHLVDALPRPVAAMGWVPISKGRNEKGGRRGE